ncbi:MAG: hypothetical protein IJ456_03830 [Bacteroides sp.]|nr:hypothetical protein [Bacteroides sp.]
MATTIHNTNDSSTVDALWTLIDQQTESVKQVLAHRLADSLATTKSDASVVTGAKWSHKYSPRINHLRSLCGKEIPQEDLEKDERLSYLLSK